MSRKQISFPSSQRSHPEPFALLRAIVVTALVAKRHRASIHKQNTTNLGQPYSPPDHIWTATSIYAETRRSLQTAMQEEHQRRRNLINARIARGLDAGDAIKNWENTWLCNDICKQDNGDITQLILPPQPPGFWPPSRWGTFRSDWSPPLTLDHHTLRITIGTTPNDQPLGSAGWGVVITRGGIITRLDPSHTPGDLIGKWAIGSLLADFGEKGGHDNESAALTACCRTLRALEDQTLLRGTPSHNTVICLPRTALRLLSGLVIPTPTQTRILTIARQKWDEIRSAAAATLPPRQIWLAGPDHGPRGIRARALARQGFISPLGDIIDTTMPPRIPDPWKNTPTECYVCLDDFGDMLPDPPDLTHHPIPLPPEPTPRRLLGLRPRYV